MCLAYLIAEPSRLFLFLGQGHYEDALISQPYITNIPACLVSTCVSAPDVAYAFEFGKRWCAKAGVDVSETLKMPETYALAAKEYFQ